MEGQRILIVEADLSTLYALRTLFAQRGWQVSSARTVAEALPALDTSAPDWLILDLSLPDGDGEVILRRLRESGRACRTAVVSGVLEPERDAVLLEWKADVVMAKPIDFVKLYSACIGIQSALTRQPVRDGAPTGYPEPHRPRRGQWLASTTR